MLNDNSDVRKRGVEVASRAINVYFLEGENYSAALEIPSAKELDALRNNYSSKISLKKITLGDPLNFEENYKAELKKLLEKKDRFSNSSTFFVRLANISQLLADKDSVINYLEEANRIDDASELKHYLANAQIENNALDKASETLNSCNLDKDVYANLRLAYLEVLKSNYEHAGEIVRRALKVDETNASAHMFQGTLFLQNRQFEKAIRNFRIAQIEKPKSSPLLVNMAAAYWHINLREKAAECLKRAVFLNPLNENAVSFYADVLHLEKMDEKALPVLERYLKFEQHSKNIWAQLGRTHFCLGRKSNGVKKSLHLNSAMEALRYEESISSTSNVWNNMGVIAAEKKEYDQAKRYYGFSIRKADQENEREILIPIFNLNSLYIETHNYGEAYTLIKSFVESKYKPKAEAPLYDKIKLQFVMALNGLKKVKDSINAIDFFLHEGLKDKNVHLDMLMRATYHYMMEDHSQSLMMSYIDQTLEFIDKTEGLDSKLLRRAYNNIAFAFLEQDRLGEAERFLREILLDLHVDPFATATFGMAKIRKGQLIEGERLYRDSLRIVKDEKTKSYFKQKMYFEIGRAYILSGESKKGIKFLERSKSEKYGHEYFKAKIKTYLSNNRLPNDN